MGTGITSLMQLDTSIFAAPGKPFQVLCPLSVACPATYLLEGDIAFVQAQLVLQLPQHSVHWPVGAVLPAEGSERCGDVYTEDVTMEQPGQCWGTHSCCREGNKGKEEEN